MVDSKRNFGSVIEFDNDWQEALTGDDSRYFIYPSFTSGRQFDLFEWIKAQQIRKFLINNNIGTGRTLEYACGAAGISTYLANFGYKAHICDLSINAIKVAHQNNHQNAPQVELSSASVADVFHLPYTSNTYDIVMSFGLLEHFELESVHILLDETIRVLKPGGLFIADIVPGPQRINIRSFGLLISYLGSFGLHMLRGDIRKLRTIHHRFFSQYFETDFDDLEWLRILSQHNLEEIKVDVCRPFPPLAISGALEKTYTRMVYRFLQFHQRFDDANTWLTRHWGWMYFVVGRKPFFSTSR